VAGKNPLAPSIREMGPAVRHNTLNDHWSGWNFRKIVGFHKSFIFFSVSYAYHFSLEGKLFVKCFEEAFKMSMKQIETFKQLLATFPPETVSKWERMVSRWEANPKAPNLYAEPKASKL